MLFNYKVIDPHGVPQTGNIEALNSDVAINALQRRGFVILDIEPAGRGAIAWLSKSISLFDRITAKDLVFLSRQLATLFEANVSALRVFRLLASESEKSSQRQVFTKIADDLQSGDSISRALSKHPTVFSAFFVSMVRVGEESGKLAENLTFLADYLDRNHQIISKVRNALVYPAFVIIAFIVVVVLMLTQVIPRISLILLESGQTLPIYTRIIIGVSDLLVAYGVFFLAALIIAGYIIWRFVETEAGRLWFDKAKIGVPVLGKLFENLYLARVADNLSTMLASGIPIAKSIEITSDVVGNAMYRRILIHVGEAIASGSLISEAFLKHREIPGIVTQIIKVGEESGEVSSILKTLANFYNREVSASIETLVSLIEPVLIVVLGAAIAMLLSGVLLPIYNFSAGLQ